jgi:hypothetical protein
VNWIGAKGGVKASKWRDNEYNWTSDDVAPDGSASPTTNVAAVSRMTGSIETWWANTDGSLQDAYWFDNNQGWQRFPLAGPGTTPQGGGVTAVTRAPDAMEMWVSGRVILPRGGLNTVTSGHYWYPWSNWGAYDLFKQTGFNVAGTERDQTEMLRFICSAPSAGCAVTESSSLLLMLTPPVSP